MNRGVGFGEHAAIGGADGSRHFVFWPLLNRLGRGARRGDGLIFDEFGHSGGARASDAEELNAFVAVTVRVIAGDVDAEPKVIIPSFLLFEIMKVIDARFA